MKKFFVLFCFWSCCCLAQTNEVTDPGGQSWDASSDMGCFWAGFAVVNAFYGFGFVLRLARRTAGHSDF